LSVRSFIVGRPDAGRAVADWLGPRLALPRAAILRLLREGRVSLSGRPCTDPHWRLRRGQRVEVRLQPTGKRGRGAVAKPGERGVSTPRPEHPGVDTPRSPRPILRFADKHVVVVDKPPGLTTMRHADEAAEFGERGRRYLPATLADLLPGLLARAGEKPIRIRAVHRLDKETSGLVVFARTAEAERHLGRQFRAHSTDRLYLALVRGRAREGRIESWLVRDRGDGRRGNSPHEGEGQRAVTHVRVVEPLGAYTLVECRLETGRTHQVRIHLGEAGTPLCGERVYDRPPHGKPLPDGSGARRIMLHAATLGFDHPATGERMRFTAPPPKDMDELVKRLRSEKTA
jgi:23S rRNA pseudouridine1911/1915/1917 synthase